MKVLFSFYAVLTDTPPPSVNELYVNGYRGRRVLSKKGHEFQAAMTKATVDAIAVLPWKQAVDAVYTGGAGVRLWIGLRREVFNQAWKPGGRTKGGNAQSPYKTWDGSNYVKVIEDAVKKATGIDDSAHLETTVAKLHEDSTSWVEIAYEVMHNHQTRVPG